ncbi:hypothetical protein [Olivibacter sp. XZL3]|uniref:hypothetical protein n=1 Tax=Olivibacter sp. XZL3 TaxID=1735116 RepID=UPI0010655239|nr:hypothetical protein [Olivibacter sp. XZL3]
MSVIRYSFFFGVIFFVCHCAAAQSFEDYVERKKWLLSSLADIHVNGSGKHGLPRALARLYNNPKDSIAINYITNALGHKGQSLFDFPGIALAISRYRLSFSADQVEVIQHHLERLAKVGDKEGKGEGFLGHGTENQALIMWCSAYLFAQELPNARWKNGMSSSALRRDMKERLRKTIKNVYAKGYAEYLSTTYEVVMDVPVLFLYELAADQEIKDLAHAYLLYKWSLLSLNNFEGLISAPYCRMNTQQDFRPASPDIEFIAATSIYNWLLWGWGAKNRYVTSDLFEKQQESTYTIYAALSNIDPPKEFFTIASGKGKNSTSLFSTCSFGQYGGPRARKHMLLGKVFRSPLYCLGTANLRWYPGGDYADFNINTFSLAWHSDHRFNYISIMSPYWYGGGSDSSRDPDTWYKGNSSPFQQIGHYENAAIVLFDIPKKDPWAGKPSPKVWAWRDQRGDALLGRNMVRIPDSVDEITESGGWIFIRAKDVYIGIRPLKNYTWEESKGGWGLDGFRVLRSDDHKGGFIFEVSDEAATGDFPTFQKRLVNSKFLYERDLGHVVYRSLAGNKLDMKFNKGLPIDDDGLSNAIPRFTVNDLEEKPYREWGIIESNPITLVNSTLEIKGSATSIKVDFKGNYPLIKNL